MENAVGSVAGGSHGTGITYVGLDENDLWILRMPFKIGSPARDEAVDNPYGTVFGNKSIDKMTADKSCSACYDVDGHLISCVQLLESGRLQTASSRTRLAREPRAAAAAARKTAPILNTWP